MNDIKLDIIGVMTLLFAGLLWFNLYTFQHTAPPVPRAVTKTLVLNSPSETNETEQLFNQMMLWPFIVRASHNKQWYISHDLQSADVGYIADCWKDPDWFRMYADPHCTLLWMRLLEHETVEDMEQILAVVSYEERINGVVSKPQQNGGARAILSGIAHSVGITGYWKPCRIGDLATNAESFTGEIISFHIDRILGFYHSPAVVPRTFSKNQFKTLADTISTKSVNPDPDVHAKLESVLHHCGRFDSQYADGAFVGWAPKSIELLSKHLDLTLQKSFFVKLNGLEEPELDNLLRTRFKITKKSKPEDINWVLENVAVNMFAILTNNFSRFGHNLFIHTRRNQHNGSKEYGPFIFLDNDRSKWTSRMTDKGKIPLNPLEHPFAKICKFPRKIALRLLTLDDASKDQKISLGKLVLWATANYEDIPSGPVFTMQEANILDSYAKYVTETIRHCLNTHPEDEVLFQESWGGNYEFMENLVGLFANLPHQTHSNTFWSNFTSAA